jgi:uncharacterized phage protein (TIGR02218 family)
VKQVDGATQAAARAWLEATHDLCYADLYDFTLADGTVWRFTSADVPLAWAGNTYRSAGLVIKRGAFSSALGVQVQTLALTVTPDRSDATLAGFVDAIDYTTLRGARVTWRGWYGDTWAAPQFTVLEFAGRVTGVEDDVDTRITCSSDLILLDVSMPRNIYQSDCSLEVYSAQCTVSRAAFTESATVLAGSSQTQILLAGPVRPASYFTRGGVQFTTGPLAGTKASIRAHLAGGGGPVLVLSVPLPAAPTAGTLVQIWPGCDKTQATCTETFGNLPHFRGYPYVPTPETAA